MRMRSYKDIVSGEEISLPPVPTQCASGACAVLRTQAQMSATESAQVPAGEGGKQ